MNIGNYQTNTDQPVAVEAVQFRDLETVEETVAWMGPEADWFIQGVDDGVVITVPTPDHTANQIAVIGDWIVKGRLGGFYVIKAEDFAQRYVASGPDVQPPAETVLEQLPADGSVVNEPTGPRTTFDEEYDVMAPTIDILQPIVIVAPVEVDTQAPTEVVVEEESEVSTDIPTEVIVNDTTQETVIEPPVQEEPLPEQEPAVEEQPTQES